MWARICGLLCWLVAAPAFGGMTYRFEIVSDSDEFARGKSESRGTVWVDADRSRIEYQRGEDEIAAYYVLIYRVGEPGAVAVNTELRTFYDQPPPVPVRRPPLPPIELREVEVGLSEDAEPEAVSGFTCRKYRLRVSYVERADYGSEVVEQRVAAEHLVWTTGEISEPEPPPPVNAKNISIGWPEVDRVVAEKLGEIAGFPIRRQTSRRRLYVGGATLATDSTLLLLGFEPTRVPAAKFEIPAGYRYQEPQILGPGQGR